jgi:type IV pilus assembly protein PilC
MFFFRRTRATILLLRQLSVLLRSGMTFAESIGALEDFPGAAVRRRLRTLGRNLCDGEAPDKAIARCRGLFGRISPAIWKRDLPPEQLGQVFCDYADEAEKVVAIKRRLMLAMAYPLTILSIGFIVTVFLLMFVLPGFEKTYADFGQALPGPTRALINLSRHWIILIIGVVFVLLTALVLLVRQPKLVYTLGDRLPLFGSVLRRSAVYCFARDLSLFMRLGTPWGEAVQNAAVGLPPLAFSRRMMQLEPKGTLKESLGAIRGVPILLLQVIGVGERSGRVGEVLQEFTRYYEREVENAYIRLVLLTEILAFLTVAALIGWAVISIYLPLFTFAGTIAG